MTRYVALLRGINVGGRQMVAMVALRELLTALGHTDVSTYLQSGNALFSARGGDQGAVASPIEQAIAAELGLDVTVLVRTGPELVRAVEANPFPEATSEPSRLHVAFLSSSPDAERFGAIDQSAFAPDEARLGDGVAYLWYPSGAGRSKLTNSVLEGRLGVRATSRNWNTVTKLVALTAAAQ